METTKLSSKGQVIIPKDVRARRHWKAGQEFDVLEVDDGVLLRPRSPFPQTLIDDVGAALNYGGSKVPVERLSIEGIPYREADEAESRDGG